MTCFCLHWQLLTNGPTFGSFIVTPKYPPLFFCHGTLRLWAMPPSLHIEADNLLILLILLPVLIDVWQGTVTGISSGTYPAAPLSMCVLDVPCVRIKQRQLIHKLFWLSTF